MHSATKPAYTTLVHLYSHCGFDGSRLPSCLDFESITPYSPYPFLPYAKHIAGDYACAMFKAVEPDIILKNDSIMIVDPNVPPPDESKLFVHSFDMKHLKFVQDNGLVLSRQRVLFGDMDQSSCYFICDPYGIYFSHNYCYQANSANNAVFVIRMFYEFGDEHIRSSVPANMAVWIGEAKLYKERFRVCTTPSLLKQLIHGLCD